MDSEELPMSDKSHRGAYKDYEDIFDIKFDFVSHNYVKAHLCSDCFWERFEPMDGWEDFKQEFEVNGRQYLLRIDYNHEGFYTK